MPFSPEKLGVFVIRKVGDALRQFRLPVAELDALLPGHLVEIAVIQHHDDEARVRPSCFQYLDTVIITLRPFICIAPSPMKPMTGRSG